MAETETCEAYSSRRAGMCKRPLDERGNCDRAADHGDHLGDGWREIGFARFGADGRIVYRGARSGRIDRNAR